VASPFEPQLKVMNTAYEPLPPVFSRPFQQLVNYLLRADPEDRPTTQVCMCVCTLLHT